MTKKNETTSATATPRAPRKPRVKIFRVEEEDTGRGGFFRAHTSVQAKAFMVDNIISREATLEEIMDIGRRDLGIGGIEGPPPDSYSVNQVARNPRIDGPTEDRGGLIQNEDHADDRKDSSEG